MNPPMINRTPSGSRVGTFAKPQGTFQPRVVNQSASTSSTKPDVSVEEVMSGLQITQEDHASSQHISSSSIPNFITFDKFDSDKISLGQEKFAGGGNVIIRNVLYEYTTGVANLMLTVPLNPESYISVQSIGVLPSKFTKSPKSQCLFVMDKDNEYHCRFIEAMVDVATKAQQHIGIQVNFPVLENETNYRIYTSLVESNEGIIYTKVYDEEKRLEPERANGSTTRPGLLFSIVHTKGATEAKLKVSLSHLYVPQAQNQFVLATMNTNE